MTIILVCMDQAQSPRKYAYAGPLAASTFQGFAELNPSNDEQLPPGIADPVRE